MAEGVGRPAHQPTDQNRLQVKTLAAVGIRHEDIAAKLGVSADTRMETCLDVSLAWCNRQRPDLDPYVNTDPAITQAVLIYAGLLWRERSSPAGFATYESQDAQAMIGITLRGRPGPAL